MFVYGCNINNVVVNGYVNYSSFFKIVMNKRVIEKKVERFFVCYICCYIE